MLCIGTGLDLILGLFPGSHVCPAGALPQLMPQSAHTSQEGLWALPCPLMAHKSDGEPTGLLDLSFLTEEEQEAIADVLKRDAHLRQLEEGRVRCATWGESCPTGPQTKCSPHLTPRCVV